MIRFESIDVDGSQVSLRTITDEFDLICRLTSTVAYDPGAREGLDVGSVAPHSRVSLLMAEEDTITDIEHGNSSECVPLTECLGSGTSEE